VVLRIPPPPSSLGSRGAEESFSVRVFKVSGRTVSKNTICLTVFEWTKQYHPQTLLRFDSRPALGRRLPRLCQRAASLLAPGLPATRRSHRLECSRYTRGPSSSAGFISVAVPPGLADGLAERQGLPPAEEINAWGAMRGRGEQRRKSREGRGNLDAEILISHKDERLYGPQNSRE
jgi:hypothetical protein